MAQERLDPLVRAETDDRLRSALDGVGIVVWDLDLATGRVAQSGSSAESRGTTSDAGAQFSGLVHPDDRARLDAALAAAYVGEQPYKAEFRVTMPDGALRWVRERGEVQRDAAGNPLRLCGVTLDITSSKQVEAELTSVRDRLEGELAGMARLHDLGQRLAAAEDASGLLEAIIETAMAVSGGERGTLELFDRHNDRLVMVAAIGFDRTLPEFCSSMRPDGTSLGGLALARKERVTVEDVSTSPIYAGTPSREVLLAAGVRSLQSTPLLSRSGRLWGVLSTYCGVPASRSPRELKLLDLFCGQIADFIERIDAERARRDSEEKFRVLANTVPDMTWMAAADGTLTFAGDRWRQYCGIDPMQHAESWPEPVLHPDDRERRRATWNDALRDGTGYEIEVRKRHRDGAYRWFLTRAAPIRGPDGKVRAWFGATTDIDDRKRMEEALREREAQLKMAVEAGGIGIWRVDPASGNGLVTGRLALMLGLPPGKTLLTAGEWQRFIHPEDRPLVLAQLKAAVAARRGFNMEFRITQPNGEVRWLMALGGVEGEPASGSPRVAGVVLDITERRTTEERQALLMAELDHRVRNILATIQAMVSLSGRSATTASDYAAGLRGRIAAMAGAHALLTRGQWHGADLADIVRHEMQAYADAVVMRGPSGCVLGAKQALDFALAVHELATNASKYGALSVPDGRVAVEWQVERGGVSGRAGSRGEIAVRFLWREDGAPPVTKPVTKGFGSRLIERALPEAALTYDRGGVCCEARLPLRELRGGAGATASAPDRVAEPVEGMAILAGCRVLVAEDEPLVALELKAALEAAGAEILIAGSLAVAGAHADAPLSAAVLDVNLADGMIYPVARRLLARGLPVLFATGYEVDAVIPADLREVTVLQKPVDSAALVRRLAAMLRRTA